MQLRLYAIVTAAYWALTVTDGALRMLVLLHFHDLGYSPVALAFLFLLYELMGIVTNLVGGWFGSRYGLNRTLYAGLGLQVVALGLLSFVGDGWVEWLSVLYVMAAQGLSGIAKDLTKMSSKSAVRLIVDDADGESSRLFTWVAALTGSKNALKGVGFFVGGALLAAVGFRAALLGMAAVLAAVLGLVLLNLRIEIGRSKAPRPLALSSPSDAINRLSAARVFLFGARDLWFVVALPVFLDEELGWSFSGIGAFLAAWVIGYGAVQSLAPTVLRRRGPDQSAAAGPWALILAAITAVIALAVVADVARSAAVVGGLVVFGAAFAVNSSLHSFLILAYTTDDEVAADVGFYYSANALGRLIGTLLSGVTYLLGGLGAALWTSVGFLLLTAALSRGLPAVDRAEPRLR